MDFLEITHCTIAAVRGVGRGRVGVGLELGDGVGEGMKSEAGMGKGWCRVWRLGGWGF